MTPRDLGAKEAVMNGSALTRHYIDLALPLIFIRGPGGVLACGYFDVNTFNHPNGRMAGVVVRGVKSFEDMARAVVREGDISELAYQRGVRAGWTGEQVLNLLQTAR